MNPTITLPLWMAITAAALPGVGFLLMVFKLWRGRKSRGRKEKKQTRTAPADQVHAFDDHIHQHILAQQIDAVFNTLVAVIETERLKLKTLAGQLSPVETVALVQGAVSRSGQKREDASMPESPAQSLGQSIADLAVQGVRPEDIAHRLGLSKNEVALAIRMSRISSQTAGKLEAVA